MKPRTGSSTRVLLLLLTILVLLNLAILGWNARSLFAQREWSIPLLISDANTTDSLDDTPEITRTPTPLESTSTVASITLNDRSSPTQGLDDEGVMLLSVRDGNTIHLFAYHPVFLPLTRISDHPWDDVSPSISPDGTRLAYSSRRNGRWDLYVLDLTSGTEEQLTDTPEYESSPTWAPDSLWIAYERYADENLDIYLLSLTDPNSAPIQLTDDPGVDCSPSWSPRGREIAFMSTRSGEEDIWLAQLDKFDDRFINISNRSSFRDRFPSWSPDGSMLAWSEERDGSQHIALWNPGEPAQPAQLIGEGTRALWSPDNVNILSEVNDPQATGLAAYIAQSGRLSMPLNPLPGNIYGMTWVKGPLPGWLENKIQNANSQPADALWQPVMTQTVAPAGRQGLSALSNVTAPQPLLHDAVDEAFNALRQQIAVEAGWDALHNLENAYVPLTTPLTPSIQNDWLYTGRAFAINPLLHSAGWLVISRDDFFGQVYWRVFLKARYQDGSMGVPLTVMVWDFNARYTGDPQAYEQGGKPGQAPAGYWIDLTELAGRYGWTRIPSWINWRTFYPSIRYNQFVMTGGLDWNQAMAEIYPLEALHTPTSVPTVTLTATNTPKPTHNPATSTPTPTQTLIPTPRATLTPDDR